jgi:hypothetical protein|tara:strand:+ start:147 stop:443 length:297 start_codon:yes stop_codon:yes gene_type:complete
MAKTITISVSDIEEKILYNDLLTTTVKDGVSNEGIKDWTENAFAGKLNSVWKRFQQEWTTKLMNDETFTDSIPSNQEAFVNLVTARADYKTRQEKEDA